MRKDLVYALTRMLQSICLLAVGAAALAGEPVTPSAKQPELRPAVPGAVRLQLRARVELFKGSGQWNEVTVEEEFPLAQTALLLCDVWNDHYCKSAVRRLGVMVPTMNRLTQVARSKGIQIVHAPSNFMDFYTGTPYRLRAQLAPRAPLPKLLDMPDPPLPVDSSDGGCDDVPQCVYDGRSYVREHVGIEIAGFDAISDDGQEVYSLFQQLGIKNMLILGVHTNMCVIGRSFGIKQMTRAGVRVVLVRDLTDTMYNPRKPPLVSHDEGTRLVVEHIEKYWCPTVTSEELFKKLQ
ncbi:MAG: isochorismatase [Planctomycetia bacterium]|nr:isochorismatase [Planctomycetia bacterium]